MKKYLRNIFNFFFPKKDNFVSELIIILYYYSGYPFYLITKFFKKPYIGSYLFSDQESGRDRLNTINGIIKNIKKKKLNILEIGVYCGQNTINLYSNFKNIKVKHFCVDIFQSFELSSGNKTFQYKKIKTSLENKDVLNLFSHNINCLQKNNKNYKFFVKKMSSKFFFKSNKQNFDLIVIDASHKFKDVFNDIKSSIKFLNNNGIIIGDDYELEAKKTSLKKLEIDKNLDLQYSNKYKLMYHPGVTLAVKYIFKNLKTRNGIFAIQYKNKKFIDLFNKNSN